MGSRWCICTIMVLCVLSLAAPPPVQGALAAAPAPPPHRQPPSAPPLTSDDDEPLPDIEDDDDTDNTTERGMYLGSPCEFTCNPKLHHVFCDPITGHCECEKKFPVKLGPNKGCAKPKSLGEQCFYRQACKYSDPHASCIQVNHNAVCQCEAGYHSVTYSRPARKVFCTEDMALLTADVHTLLGVCSGIATLAGLLCLVLHLYTKGRQEPYVRGTHYADATMPPPGMYNSETGIPLALQSGRPSSRSSNRSSYNGRRGCPSSPRSGGGVSSSRAGAARAAAILLISCHMPERRALSLPAAGSRRPSLVSLQSSTSSVRSYSMRRFEKEREQKEKRQQMQMRLAQLHANMTSGRSKSTDNIMEDFGRNAPTPSPRTPNSTDGLLPAVCEGRELSLNGSPDLRDRHNSSSLEGIIGPCSSSGTSY